MAGRLLGVFQSVNSLAMILSMVWGGAVFQYASPQAVFALSAGLLALAAALSVTIGRHTPARESAGSCGTSMETTADLAPLQSETGNLS